MNAIYDLKYPGSQAAIYDPLTTETSSQAICNEFAKEINTLQSVNNNSVVDALRFSYEVSFVNDVNA